jgi:hypothetical protein
MKNERDIPGMPPPQLQRKQRMVKRLACRAPVLLAKDDSCILQGNP